MNKTEKFNLPRMKRKTAELYNFYQIPKVLLQNKTFSGLDGWSILLFAMLFDRTSLSAENANDFTDENGDIFIIFTVEEAMEKCCKSKPIICKCFKQLEDMGLIERKRRGLGKPSIIYVNDFTFIENTAQTQSTSRSKKSLLQEVKNVDFKKSNNFTSCGNENLLQEVKNVDRHINNTDINNTDFINIESNLVFSAPQSRKEKIRAEIKQQIEYEYLRETYPREQLIDDIFEIMVEIMSSTRNYWTIGGEEVPTIDLQERVQRIDSEQIEFIIDNFLKQSCEIKKPKAYLIKCLYNEPLSTNAYWENRVRSDGVVGANGLNKTRRNENG